jgi:ATP-dependent DNA helicase HFM1/MER3
VLNFIPELADLGIGVHHAGLALEDRKRVEDMFLKGLLRIVFATSVELKGSKFRYG